MNNSVLYSVSLIAVIALVTIFIRFLPFLLFRNDDKLPEAFSYLGRVLPGAIMGMLVVYCFKSTKVTAWPFALPELIATTVVVATYIWKRNTLLSIGIGTILYMVLIQAVIQA